MKINSVLVENNFVLFSENLNKYAKKSVVSKEIKKENKGIFTAKTHLKLSRNFAIINTAFQLEKPFTDIFSISGEYVMISCVFKGESQLNTHQGKIMELGQTFLSYQNTSSEHIKMPASQTRYICIILKADYYLKLLKNENWGNNDFFFKQVTTQKYIPLGTKHVPLAFELQQIINTTINCKWESALQLDYLELKLKEILLLFHYQFQITSKKNKHKLSTQTIEKLKKAQAFLMANYKNPPTIKMLSRIILLNEVELKRGFKALFGSTIRTYIIELRMRKAAELIKDHTVNDIAGILGYKSVPHFINTFKKHYGVTPKQLFTTNNIKNR